MSRIENWSIGHSGDEYTAPELRIQQLFGTVYDHEVLDDGTDIRSSSVTKIDLPNRIIATRNSTYSLGAPDPKYLEAYPEISELLGKENHDDQS